MKNISTGFGLCVLGLGIGSAAFGSNRVLRLESSQSAGSAGSTLSWEAPNQTGELTVEFWLRLEPETQTQSGFGRPFSLRGCSCGGITCNAFASGSSGRLEFELGAIGAWTSDEFSLSQWHHFVCTWNRIGNRVQIYRDGVLVLQRGIAPMSSIQICNQSDLRFGEQCGRGIVGAVDNVRYWSVERSASQIVAGMSSQYTAAEAQAAEGLIGSWSFEDGFVSNATGTSGQGKLQSEAMVAEEVLVPDCNSDGIVDFGQILDGTFADVNSDGIPDVCQAPCVPSDLNNDRSVDGADLGVLLSAWGPAGPEPTRADINGNGIVDGADLGVLLANWGACGEAPPWATVVQWQPDPAVVTDDQLRSAIAATGLPWRVRDAGTQIEMLLVPPGTFQMGCIMGSDLYGCGGYELPVHDVTLTNAFYLARYELTQADWVSRMGSNPSQFQSANPAVPVEQVPSRPVEGVTWSAAQAFLFGTGLRLPTEAEWELACRAGTVTPFFNGSTDDSTLHKLAWYWDNACQGGTVCGTRPVGGRLANALGFHDMLGNVYEWVSDWFGPYGLERQTNPTGPSFGTYRVLRGASWVDDPDVVRSSDRYYSDQVNGRVGFRVARNP